MGSIRTIEHTIADANDSGPDADAGPAGTLVLLGRSATQVLFLQHVIDAFDCYPAVIVEGIAKVVTQPDCDEDQS